MHLINSHWKFAEGEKTAARLRLLGIITPAARIWPSSHEAARPVQKDQHTLIAGKIQTTSEAKTAEVLQSVHFGNAYWHVEEYSFVNLICRFNSRSLIALNISIILLAREFNCTEKFNCLTSTESMTLTVIFNQPSNDQRSATNSEVGIVHDLETKVEVV